MSKRKKKKKSNNSDDSYETEVSEEMEEAMGNKSQVKKKKKQKKIAGRPPATEKYEFTNTDLKLIECSLLTEMPPTGVDYGLIKVKYFKDKVPEVANKDIQNQIYKNPHLKGILTQIHSRIKGEHKLKFDNSINSMNIKKEQKVEQTQATTITTAKEYFFLQSDNKYVYVLRQNRGEIVDLEVDLENNMITFVIESRELFEEEIECLYVKEELQQMDKKLEDVFTFDSSASIRKIPITLPVDCRVEEVERYNSDTPYGAIVEVVIPRKLHLNAAVLKGQRYAHYSTSAKSTVPLVSEREEKTTENFDKNK